jgi:cytochrome c-type biogenesis protein CcmE
MTPEGTFKASQVLAKHDENYMPPEAAHALKQAGHPMAKENFAGQGSVKR